jgi:stearoyl-CoA desaturase (delta-9 desaturase)
MGNLVNLGDIFLLAGMYVPIALGVTIGYHRYLTHGSFKTNRVFKVALTILGAMSFEGSPVTWVANHRLHHAYADREGDLHSPTSATTP